MKHNIWLTLATIFLFLPLTGCATFGGKSTQSSQSPKINSPEVSSTEKGWHYARFSIPRPKGARPNWSMGTLVAVEVIQPTLKKHRNSINLWRFHRRAALDNYGHVFSFIFYSPKNTASHIYQDVQTNPVLQRLIKEKKITLLTPDDLSKNKNPDIEDTSDKNWSEVVQKTWPHFIMGVSQMWLDIVSEINDDLDKTLPLEKRYQKVHNTITGIWQREGKHAILHHLNAIYAYQPLLMRY